MKVFLSSVPGFILAQELQRNSVKQWIYFGTDHSVLKKLERIFDKRAEQVDYGEKLYAITMAQRNQFVLWIDQVAADLVDRKEWLFSVSSVKNTYTSHLFLYICYLFLLEELIKEGKQPDLIFVDSPALAAIFKDNFPVGVAPINGWLRLGFYFKVLTKSILRFGKYLIEFGRRFVWAKIILKDRSRPLLKGKNNLILIRNFITGQFSDTPDDIIESHYFPGLYDYLRKKNYTPVFLPVVTQTSNYRNLYQKIIKSKKTIIFPEEFLKLQDYLYTFLAPVRALSLRLSAPFYGRYQIGRLLKEEYYSNLTEFGFLYATLLSCLGKRFKEHNLFPLGIINWMENQALEKGLIKGFKENLPDTQIIGSQPFIVPKNYFSTIPSNQEKQSGLLPDKILVLGPIGEECAIQFIKDVPVDYSPAFRYASVFSGQSINNQENNLLVLLSLDFKNALYFMQILLKIEPYLKVFDRIMIKLHSAAHFDKKQLMNAAGGNLSQLYEFVDGKLEQYISKTSIGFCGATGTAVELVMRGIPVITMGSPYTLTMDYLGYRKDPDIWQLCFSCEQVITALNYFQRLKRERSEDLIRKAHEFRNVFIAPPSEKYWENYLIEKGNSGHDQESGCDHKLFCTG